MTQKSRFGSLPSEKQPKIRRDPGNIEIDPKPAGELIKIVQKLQIAR